MGVIRPGVNLGVFEELAAQPVLGQHTLDRVLQREGWLAVQPFFQIFEFQPTRIAGVAVVDFLFALSTG